jgi:hypothetical protein
MPQLLSQMADRPSASRENKHIARFNWFLLLLSAAGLIISCILCFHIWQVYDNQPVIFDDDDGYLTNRVIMNYTLDESRIRAYLQLVLGKLFNTTPGSYNIDDMTDLIDTRLIRKYTTSYLYSREQRARIYERHDFHLRDVRRYQPEETDQLVLVVRGDLNTYSSEHTTGDLVTTEIQTTGVFNTKEITDLVYLARDTPSTENPWGLIITRIIELTRPEVAQKIWEASPPLHGTVVDGYQILKFQRDSLPKTTQPKSSRTDAKPAH